MAGGEAVNYRPGKAGGQVVDFATTRIILKNMSKTKEPQQPALTEAQVREAVRIEDTRLLDNVYELAELQVERAEAHRAAIDEKTAQFLGLTGGTFTLAFTVGGLFLENVLLSGPAIKAVPHSLVMWTWALWVGALIVTLVAVGFCFAAYRARSDYRGVHDADIFNVAVIEQSDRNMGAANVYNAKPLQQGDAKAYRRYMAVHFWKVAKRNYAVNESKGRWLKVAQVLFIVSLVGMVSSGTLAACAAVQQKSAAVASQEGSAKDDSVGIRGQEGTSPQVQATGTSQPVRRDAKDGR